MTDERTDINCQIVILKESFLSPSSIELPSLTSGGNNDFYGMTSQAGQLNNNSPNKPAFKIFVVAALLFISVLTFACKPSPPPHITDPGQIIYLGYKDTYASCARCHGDEGQGSQQGPDIRNAISDLGRKEARKIIVFGKKSEEYKEEMPAFGEELTPEEIGFVIDFITHWGISNSTAGDTLIDKK